jgi:hypothetical protein
MLCPNCQRPLVAVPAADPSHAPWRCPPCYLAWWNCELAADVAGEWDPTIPGWPGSTWAILAPLVAAEAAGIV